MVASFTTKHEALADRVAKHAASLCMDGRRKFFVEIYKLCKDDPALLFDGVVLAQKTYLAHHNPTHILKSLVYFAEAESDPMPTLFFKANWEDIKKYFRAEVPRIAKQLLHLK